MDFHAVVDVVIGVTLVYLATSLLVTTFNEYIAQMLKLRGRALARSLQSLIDAPAIANALKGTRTLGILMGKPGKPPSYVDPGVFADELLGALVAGTNAPNAAQLAAQNIVGTIEALPASQLRTTLRGIAIGANNDIEKFKSAVGEWVDKSLTMLGEHYKRSLQLISLAVGLSIAIAFNIDTLHLINRLYTDTVLRQQVADFAESVVADTNAELIQKCTAAQTPPAANQDASAEDAECAPIARLMKLVSAREESELSLPIGWGDDKARPAFGLMVLGWLLTACAVSLGASFWFDLLSKIINLRYGMRKPEAPPEE